MGLFVFFSFSSFPEWISFQFSFYCLKVFIGFTVLVCFLFVFCLFLNYHCMEEICRKI